MLDRASEMLRSARAVKDGGPTVINIPGLVFGPGRPDVIRRAIYGPYMKVAVNIPNP